MNSVMKIFLVVLIFLMTQSLMYSQPVTWQKWFDYNNYDSEASDAIQTFDRGYLILTNNFATPAYSILLIKVDYLGIIEWQKPIDKTVIGFGLSCFSLSQTIDSGYVISGYGNNAVLLKTDCNGDLLWVKNFTRQGFNTRFFDHTVTHDGSIISVGDIASPFRSYIVKTDSKGSLQWDSIYNFNSTQSKIIQSSLDESYYFSVRDRISKIDSIGRLIWTKPYNYIGGDILQTPTGDIYTATGNNAFYLNKIDTSSKLIWQKNYYPDSRCSGLCLSKDGNLLLTGFQTQVFVYEIFALKTDLNGDEIFGKTITSFTGNFFALPRSVNATIDSGFIFAGITDFPNEAMQRNNAFATKTDSACNAPKFVGAHENVTIIPNEFELNQNYPNPFNSSTIINYKIKRSGLVNLDLFDIRGRKILNIINKYHFLGNYRISLKTNELKLASGMYYLRMSFKDPMHNNQMLPSQVKKIILAK